MAELGADLAKQAKRGDIFLLEGSLGAGKTVLAAGFVKELCGDVEVLSPTFTILNLYEGNTGEQLYHYDLYRIENENEMQELGLEEAIGEGIVLIEWPSRLGKFKIKKAKTIKIKVISASEREVIITNGD